MLVQFPCDFVSLRIAWLQSHSQLVRTCNTFRTCPPPAIATALAMTNGQETSRCGQILTQVCNVQFIFTLFVDPKHFVTRSHLSTPGYSHRPGYDQWPGNVQVWPDFNSGMKHVPYLSTPGYSHRPRHDQRARDIQVWSDFNSGM